jgi:hypothetical protein
MQFLIVMALSCIYISTPISIIYLYSRESKRKNIIIYQIIKREKKLHHQSFVMKPSKLLQTLCDHIVEWGDVVYLRRVNVIWKIDQSNSSIPTSFVFMWNCTTKFSSWNHPIWKLLFLFFLFILCSLLFYRQWKNY